MYVVLIQVNFRLLAINFCAVYIHYTGIKSTSFNDFCCLIIAIQEALVVLEAQCTSGCEKLKD
jgi:hypothetical protein